MSGNPAGKPKGARHRATVMLERLLADDAAAVVKATVAAARSGDMTAARIIIDRVLPARRGRPVRLELPAIEAAADVLRAQAAVIAAMSEGTITPDEATVISGVLEAHRRAVELTELDQRVRRLEEQRERWPHAV